MKVNLHSYIIELCIKIELVSFTDITLDGKCFVMYY